MTKINGIVLTILIIILLLECIIIIRFIDISGLCTISSDAWLAFIASILQILITVVGFIITIFQFAKEREEKEKPFIIIKTAKETDCNYICDNEDNNYTQHIKKYIEIVNKGDIIIKNPTIKNEESKINNIFRLGTRNELDTIEPQNLQTNNKYVICIDINYSEGMRRVYIKLI